jgi:heme/copper-type cytochrome/quinol oxidase subunit 3
MAIQISEQITHPAGLLRQVPAWLTYSMALFIATRAILFVIAFIAYSYIPHVSLNMPSEWLRVWKVWDSVDYISIAQNGYFVPADRTQMANYAFFPLYPLLIRLLDTATSDPALSGFIISNACLFVACFYLYRLVRLESDEPTALRSIKYLFLFPAAFVLSGILTESLFLALSLACLYYAKKGNWPLAGVAGFFTALTRPYGVIIILPVLYEYFRSKGFRLEKAGADALYMLLIPAGISVYGMYCYYLMGDPLAFLHVQAAYGGRIVNPVMELWYRLSTPSGLDVLFGGCFTLIAIVTMLLSYKKVGFSLWIYGLLLILIPLSTPSSAWSMARYIVAAFPLYIAFAKLGENRSVDDAATLAMALLQGLLMAIWATWGYYVV